MRLAHLAGHGSPLVAVRDGELVVLTGSFGDIDSVDDLAAAGPEAWAEARAAVAEAKAGAPLEPDSLACPLRDPSKIACVGLNYRDHCREAGVAEPSCPLIFAKFPSALAGPGEPVRWPAGLTDQVDWEAELAVVVGRRMRDVEPAQVLAGVFGYTAANDVSARDMQFGDEQWVRGKSLDTFCPLGPVIVTADEFGDPQRKAIRSRVNGRAMQDSSTSEMIFPVAEVLSFLSRTCTLEPGDVVLTGTPWGVGAFRSPAIFLADGDVVEVEVEGVGVLRSPVRIDP